MVAWCRTHIAIAKSSLAVEESCPGRNVVQVSKSFYLMSMEAQKDAKEGGGTRDMRLS